MRTSSVRVRTLAAAIGMALVASACSDDNASTDSTRPPTSDTAASGTASSGTATSAASTTAAPPTTVGPLPSAGCDADTSVRPGEDELVTTTSGGTQRMYYRHVPTSQFSSALPVIIDLHGYSEGAAVHLQMSGLGAFGDDEGFVTITPQGSGPVAMWDTGFESADMVFIGDLLDEIEATLCVDRARIFVAGLSNGAFMSSAIACVYSDRVAAVAPIAGVRDIEGCEPQRPVPMMTMHGTADGFVSFDGGLGEDALDLPAPDGSGETLGDSDLPPEALEGPSVPETVAAWAERNGCSGELDPEALTDVTSQPFGDDVVLHEFDCPSGANVRFFEIVGGGHTWPGSEFARNIESILGFTTFSVSANEQMWNFFVHAAFSPDAVPAEAAP